MLPGPEVIAAAELPAWLIRLAAFVGGALWGSFFNVAIYRWPRGMSVVKPPSHCPACGAPVRWYLNVPIVGYIALRGRAACCGAPMTPRYVLVELLTGVLGMAVAERFFVSAPEGTSALFATLESVLYFIFVGGLVIATFVDLEWMEIPDEVSLPGAALGLATAGFRNHPGALEAAVGAGVGFLIVQLAFVWGYELITGRRGMGEGDAKLLLMIGAFLGWQSVLFVLVAGSFQGLLAAGVAMILGVPLIPQRPDEQDQPANQASEASSEEPNQATEEAPQSGPPMMVFGPMLALSAIEYLFFGEQIASWIAERVAF
ncbi:MAG: prepilin peptidase [Myxococcales bacterium]